MYEQNKATATSNLKQEAPLGRDSGLTQAAYCWDHDLCPHNFSYNKRKYSTGPVPVNLGQSY
ncbi:IS66 family insertion sequence element accessory protein TnpA [Paraglaciecola psychrophila]|uniref:Uncharacterized protein n=1 Tax=Paraglaciecola psychrophila 170 TaxID=1129794 RepID=K7AJ21_9ALTE|nr:hypothetical protein C427_5368 [Paraglaciecola psychrophila 170]GAC40573.1 hypothetical protein GPSY_4972 [Paraglaciecola psychrophila 170]